MCQVPLDVVPISSPYTARNLQLIVNSMYGYLAGLQYFDIQGTGAVLLCILQCFMPNHKLKHNKRNTHLKK